MLQWRDIEGRKSMSKDKLEQQHKQDVAKDCAKQATLESKYKFCNAFSSGKKAFIPFVTCGYPSVKKTEQIIYTLAEQGADIIEIGIPFSDPVAEGETIQKANALALQQGVHCEEVFDLVKKVRAKTQVRLAFMTYANIVYAYGVDRFISKMASLGVGGLILADVPYEERNIFANACKQYKVDFISLIAPSSKKRVEIIAKKASGFIYCVSSLGVTGIRSEFDRGLESIINEIRKHSSVPVAVGFGISNATQAKEVAQYADGVIIGSAIMKLCEQYGTKCVEHIATFAKDIRGALDSI